MVFTQFWLILQLAFKIASIAQQPRKQGFLYLLVVFFLEEFITKELQRTLDVELAPLRTDIKRSSRSVCRKTNRPRRQQRLARLAHVDRAAVRVHKLEPAVLVSVGQVVLCVAILLGILTRLF